MNLPEDFPAVSTRKKLRFSLGLIIVNLLGTQVRGFSSLINSDCLRGIVMLIPTYQPRNDFAD